MTEKHQDEKIIFESLQNIQYFHSLDDREYWEKLKTVIYEPLKKRAEYFDEYKFEPLYASLFMEFTTKKNRLNYELRQFDRRKALNTYMFLEAVENEGKYIEKILDLVWMILEETEWALPAHTHNTESADVLPFYKEPTVCIYSAQTAANLAFAYMIFKDKFDAISKNISIRIKDEVTRRIIDEYMRRDDYWYMGFLPDRKPNNWTSWVNVNVLLSSIAFVDDKEKLAKIISKILVTSYKLLQSYPEDGSSEEGASYATSTGIDLLDCFDIIDRLTCNKFNLLKNKKLKNLSAFIYDMYINDKWRISFADSDSKSVGFSSVTYRIGKLTGNNRIMAMMENELLKEKDNFECWDSTRAEIVLKYAESILDIRNNKTQNQPLFSKDIYYESNEIMVARENEANDSGLYLAAKGGHNGELHNHNDLGNFIVCKDGERFLIDTGRAAYTAVAHSPQRFTLWYTNSDYHNLPTINGKNQHDSEFSDDNFTSKDVTYKKAEDMAEFSLDIWDAYENKDEINKWKRSIVFDRNKKEIRVTEDYDLKKCESITLNFMSAVLPEAEADGIKLCGKSGAVLKIYIDISQYDFEAEEIYVGDDFVLKTMWDENLYRIRLKVKNPKPSDKLIYTIK